ncbi:hypothetical protein CLCR_03667 [Cladophialophora carrionii]|uniref:Uncharacterized protein n=1 Tax=Cladophialophora carrionii TaxID=86049 RepID=A0A1C1CHB4_9EURO|nr:hypothetical protein CLCR_03667 [Cladophialophora carrionii]
MAVNPFPPFKPNEWSMRCFGRPTRSVPVIGKIPKLGGFTLKGRTPAEQERFKSPCKTIVFDPGPSFLFVGTVFTADKNPTSLRHGTNTTQGEPWRRKQKGQTSANTLAVSQSEENEVKAQMYEHMTGQKIALPPPATLRLKRFLTERWTALCKYMAASAFLPSKAARSTLDLHNLPSNHMPSFWTNRQRQQQQQQQKSNHPVDCLLFSHRQAR